MAQTLIITERGVLHLFPTWEACNLDAVMLYYHVPDQGTADERMARAMNDRHYRRKCRRCFPAAQAEGPVKAFAAVNR